MEKNVSGVDLDELQKAREALDKERGVETDPNLYNDYNPNRESVELQNSLEEKSETTEKESLSDYENITNSTSIDSDSNTEDVKDEIPDVSDLGKSEENLSKFDNFAAFEVKENAPEQSASKNENAVNQEEKNQSNETGNLDEKIDSELEKIENFEDLENLMNDLLLELDDEEEELADQISEIKAQEPEEDEDLEILNEMLGKTLKQDEAGEKTDNEVNEKIEKEDNLTGIDVEPKFENVEVTIQDEAHDETESDDVSSEELSENVHEIKTDSNPIANLSVLDLQNVEKDENDVSQEEQQESVDENEVEETSEKLEQISEETNSEDDLNASEETSSEDDLNASEETSSEEATETETSSDDTNEGVSEESEQENAEENLSLDEDYIGKLLGKTDNPEPVQVPEKRKVMAAENSATGDDVEVITDYSQLRDILQKQLKEPDVVEEDEFKKQFNYKEIDEFKFIDEIVSDGFKHADKFSYILGRNEKNEMVYGNFKQHCNLAVFGKNDSVTNSFLNSMILSLCLKNSFHDVNFVLLDSDINSSFEVYNKSSYLYFNRIAKTNKEILDTLIEVSKEVDARYEKFAKLGVKNIDAYNEIVAENNLEAMPQVILVFNNYTSASQATNHDRINACLYQILKYGRITGIYAVVAAKLPIDVNQINYSLSSRISFKSDEDSTFTVGDEGAEFLPNENDAIYYNISTNRSEHVKIATVSDIELDLIIKDLEE